MAQCQACHGMGYRLAWFRVTSHLDLLPCQRCGGSGWEREGLREQPEQARTAASAPLPPENNDKR
jgi:hypothetical protein